MSLTVSIRFLTGRAHLHPWQTHHSEGRIEWPPSHWRLLRALVAVAGRGLTSLPYPDDMPPPIEKWESPVIDLSSLKKKGVPADARGKLSYSKKMQMLTLKEPLTDAECKLWKLANPSDEFELAIDTLQALATQPTPKAMSGDALDTLKISDLASLMWKLSSMPTIWLPKSSGGHTRQYFPIHAEGRVKASGSTVFDTFATVDKEQPLLYHWMDVSLDDVEQANLRQLLNCLTYFGRAESWCCVTADDCSPAQLDQVVVDGERQTHWECVCIEGERRPSGKEYRDYTLERRLAPVDDLRSEVTGLFVRTKPAIGTTRKEKEIEALGSALNVEDESLLLLRCLLRESGQDIKDGLERPIGTRWVHYAVPRAIFDLPRPKPKARVRREEVVDLVRYALNTATVGRAVLPPLTDTLLVADKFRSATLAVYGEMFNKRKPNPNKSRNYDDSEFFPKALCGRERDGSLCQDHSHAFWWPVDEDNDGFIDHVMVHAPGRFDQNEADALRRLTRLKQRGGRPDLLVTPIYVGKADEYAPWKRVEDADSPGDGQLASVFVSATPFFSPVHLSHGRNRPGRLRSLQAVVRKSLRNQQLIDADNDLTIDELIFDYDPAQLANLQQPIESSDSVQSQPPRQLFQNREEADIIPPLPSRSLIHDVRYPNAMIKDPDAPYCLGTSTGLVVDDATRFIRTLSFCRRRRNHQLQGKGRMLCITFNRARSPKPFAIGAQCHFGMGLFVAEKESDAI